MSNVEFFSISGLACAAHTPETKKIWQSWSKNKSDYGRLAILEFAKDLGFEYIGEPVDSGTVKEAFNYLLNQLPDISGKKSYILRTAIINYS